MELNLELYGTLGRMVDGYEHKSGIDLTLPEKSTLDDLLVHLNLPFPGLGMIFMNNKPLPRTSQLAHGARIKIFQPVFGG